MNEQDVKEFVDFIYANNDILIRNKVDEGGNIQVVKEIGSLDFTGYYIYSPGAKLVIKETGFVDDVTSDVIEFSVPRKKGEIMERGRLYVIIKDWDWSGNLYTKSPEFEKKYNFYKRYITKNYIKSLEPKGYYIGPHAYEWYRSDGKCMAGPIVEVKF